MSASSQSAGAAAPAATSRGVSGSAKRLTLVATILGSSIAILDGSVVSVALPSIQRSLGGGLAGQQWVSNAYLRLRRRAASWGEREPATVPPGTPRVLGRPDDSAMTGSPA